VFKVCSGCSGREEKGDFMTEAKKLLLSIMKRDKIIEYKLEELERQKRLCEVRGINFEGERVQGSPKNENPIIEYIQMKDDVQAYINETIKLKRELMKVIDKMEDGNCIGLLYKRYFMRKSYNEIAKEAELTYKRIQQLHDKALRELDDLIKLEKIRQN
jgi:DNA-directed RNA polymerase specialized sigma subunit